MEGVKYEWDWCWGLRRKYFMLDKSRWQTLLLCKWYILHTQFTKQISCSLREMVRENHDEKNAPLGNPKNNIISSLFKFKKRVRSCFIFIFLFLFIFLLLIFSFLELQSSFPFHWAANSTRRNSKVGKKMLRIKSRDTTNRWLTYDRLVWI